MIPIENSVAGRVADIHHLLPQSGPVHRRRMVFADPSPVMAPTRRQIGDIKSVESHVHALGQCRRIIRKRGIKPIVSADTAGSARIVAERRRQELRGDCVKARG